MTMDTADLLVKQMFSWMKQREECANKLEKLAQELETHRENCSISQTVGSTAAVVGSGSLVGARLATVFTGGAAASLIGVAGGVCTGLSVGVSSIAKLVEHFIESETMKDAMKAESEVHIITERIQRLFEKLKEECKKANPNAKADDLDQHAMTEIVGAIAKQSGLDHHYIKQTFQRCSSHGEPEAMGVYMDMASSKHGLLIQLAGLLTLFCLKPSGGKSKVLFAKGTEQLIKEVCIVRAVLIGGSRAVGGAYGIGFALPEAINHWQHLIKKNNVTEASQSLKNTADDLRQINYTLRAQLDKIKQMLEELDQLKCCIENSNRTSEEKKNFMMNLMKYCHDQAILNWFRKNYDSEIFPKLADIFYLLTQELDKKKKKTDREDIDIIFVAHGAIQEPLIPARTLLPLSTIEDVILYSPWNCTIDANIVYRIATGDLKTQHRIFCCRPHCCCSNQDKHRPNTLPPNWNSMKNAGDSMIPNILVSPLKHPEDLLWKTVLFLEGKFGEPGKNRVVIPYIIQGHKGGHSMTIPFYVVTLALSLVLCIFSFTARVHLAACLGRSPQQTLMKEAQDLEKQYAWANNDTCMTAKIEDIRQDLGSNSQSISGLLRRLFSWFGY